VAAPWWRREDRRRRGRRGESLQQFLERHRFSRAFVERLIVPQVSAVWSADRG
jgi:predicted NAD/FAD-binding protein